MTVGELMADYRRRFGDTNSSKYALTDDDYLDILNEAQDHACIRGDLVFDKTSSFCTINVVVGTSIYEVDPIINNIRFAYLTKDEVLTLLLIRSREFMDRMASWRGVTGKPIYLIPERLSIELTPIPDDDYTLSLEVYRLPERLINDSSTPEIQEMFHRPLNDWVMYRASSLPDEEFSNLTKAADYYRDFERVFGHLPLARSYHDRTMPHRNKSYP
jgi:hypothetical protein